MNSQSKQEFLDIREAAEFLKISEKNLMQMVDEKAVPHSIFPGGQIRFWPDRLKDWGLSFEKMKEYKDKNGSVTKSAGISLTEEITSRFGYETRESSRWINLCMKQIVFAQLHPSRTSDGLDLALRECGDDSSLPKCTVLKRIDIRQLNGYYRTNIGWLKGTLYTNCPAAAFQIPSSLHGDRKNPGWKELENLLEHARKKLEPEIEEKQKKRIKQISL